jgi:glycosyltransferase involved in cell wall biosynthesis
MNPDRERHRYPSAVHILALANELAPTGGLERVQLEVHQALHHRGHRTTLVHETGGELAPSWTACTERRVQIPTARFLPGHPARTARSIRTVSRTIRQARPDVVYLHWYRHLHLAAPAARALGIPIVQHIHAPPPASLGPVGRRLIRVPAAAVAVSRHTATGWSTYRDDIGVVHNGVDLDTFAVPTPDERAARRERWGVAPDTFVVGFSGRITPAKGIEELLEAWRLLDWDPARHRLLVVGKPWPDTTYRPVGDHQPGVEWLGFQLDRMALLAVADVVAIPSTWPDPGPLAVIEAVATGTPLVAAAVGGIPELLPAETDDLLVAPGDPGALAERLRDLRDRTLPERQNLRKVLRAHAESALDLRRVVDQIEQTLDAAAAGRRG